jgi:SPP1 gp7 family putative phage head morphogenesis protein
MRYEIEMLKTNQYKTMTDLLSVNYLAAYTGTQFTIAQGVESAINFEALDKAGIEEAVKTRWDKRNYSDSIWQDKDKLLDALTKTLPQSFARGLRADVIGDLIAKELNVSKNRGRALARTEVNYLSNQADLNVYKAIGIEEYEFLATLDMRTSDICRSMDGFKGKISQVQVGVNFPPMHVNCRSTTIAYFADSDSVERVARNGEGKNIKVSRRMTQEEWIKKYVPEEDKNRLLKFMKKFGTEEKS